MGTQDEETAQQDMARYLEKATKKHARMAARWAYQLAQNWFPGSPGMARIGYLLLLSLSEKKASGIPPHVTRSDAEAIAIEVGMAASSGARAFDTIKRTGWLRKDRPEPSLERKVGRPPECYRPHYRGYLRTLERAINEKILYQYLRDGRLPGLNELEPELGDTDRTGPEDQEAMEYEEEWN
jgi:hypothetical protein